MAAFEEKRAELLEQGVSIFAASVDSQEQVQEVASSGVHFPLAWGVNRGLAERLGAWWEPRRNHIQPSEFIIRQDGRILQSSYSSGPLARTDPSDVLKMVDFIETLAKKKKEAADST